MPKYEYKCKTCNEHFFLRHGIKEKIEKRPTCEKECDLERIPTISFRKIEKKKKKVGKVVRDYIEDTKKEIEEEKEHLKQDYKP